MKQLILLHGFGATAEDQWLPYIKNHFTQLGWKVVAPTIPDSDKADLERWRSYIEQEVSLTSNTIVVGHSAGCPLIVSLLEHAEVKIKKAILVAGFIEAIDDMIAPLIQPSYDWDKIRGNCNEFIYVNSVGDPYKCNDRQGRLLLDKLGGTQITMEGNRHFGTSEFNEECSEFPFLIKLIED